MKKFLPISKEEIVERGWDQIDFLFVSGDAYVDHPSFGPAVICRVLEAQGIICSAASASLITPLAYTFQAAVLQRFFEC